jgi:hypothetical protein
MNSLEIKMLSVMDAIANHNIREYGLHLEIGIHDWDVEPMTFYTVIKNNNGSVVIGKSSYGSVLIEDGINCIIDELEKGF